MNRLRLPLAGLALIFASGAGAVYAPEPSVTIAARGNVEIAFSPHNDPEAALLRVIGEAREQIGRASCRERV